MDRSTEALAAPSGAGSEQPRALRAQFGSDNQCVLDISGTAELGPQAGQSFHGSLSFTLGPNGDVDAATIEFADGTILPVVGQAAGRSIRFRIGSNPDRVLTLTGAGEYALEQCAGSLTGMYAGPGVQDIGVWSAVAHHGE